MSEKERISNVQRRGFLKKCGYAMAGTLLSPGVGMSSCNFPNLNPSITINAHLWVYASKFPPNWDCSSILNKVFSDLSYAGINGVELMEVLLRQDDSVDRLRRLIDKYSLPVSGSSYGVGISMWDIVQHKAIMDDIKTIIPRLGQVGGRTLGISVGNKPGGLKTEKELDAQAHLLRKIIGICLDNGIEANLHNHTYEVENGMHDLKGTLSRIPDMNLGPDLNWLIRAGVDPVQFINSYGKQIVYLHIRDQYKDGTWSEFVGQGDTDFKPIAKALKSQNFNGQVAVELAFPDGFTPKNELREDWKLSREFVSKTFGW